MKIAGLKQKELAKIMNMTPETLRKRTRSPWLFVIGDITKMAGALGVPAENLFALSVGKKCPTGGDLLI